MTSEDHTPSRGRGRPVPVNKAGLGRQFAALPVRRKGGQTLVLLVTSRETKRWVLPKGWAEIRRSGPGMASKEAFEEAGIQGSISTRPIGGYRYLKRLPLGHEIECKVKVYLLKVRRLLDDWPERGERRREWFRPDEAAGLVDEPELAALLRGLREPGRPDGREDTAADTVPEAHPPSAG